jgi:hypothetical protein
MVDDSTSISWESVDDNFTQLGGCADFLRPFNWSRVSGVMQFCNGSDKGTALDFVKISEKM